MFYESIWFINLQSLIKHYVYFIRKSIIIEAYKHILLGLTKIKSRKAGIVRVNFLNVLVLYTISNITNCGYVLS